MIGAILEGLGDGLSDVGKRMLQEAAAKRKAATRARADRSAMETLYANPVPGSGMKPRGVGQASVSTKGDVSAGDRDYSFNTDNMDQGALAAYSRLEGIYGGKLPIKGITSTYRSPEHNAKVRGAKRSQHMHGKAFDVDVSNLSKEERKELIRNARRAGFGGVGVYANSLHFDTGPTRNWGGNYKSDSTPKWALEALSEPVGGAISSEPIISTKGGVEPQVEPQAEPQPAQVSARGLGQAPVEEAAPASRLRTPDANAIHPSQHYAKRSRRGIGPAPQAEGAPPATDATKQTSEQGSTDPTTGRQRELMRIASDPNVSDTVRTRALRELDNMNKGDEPLTYTSQVWVDNGDGTRTRWGVNSQTGATEKVKTANGKPLTEKTSKADKEETVKLGKDIGGRIKYEMKKQGKEDYLYDEDAHQVMEAEIARLMQNEKMSRAEAITYVVKNFDPETGILAQPAKPPKPQATPAMPSDPGRTPSIQRTKEIPKPKTKAEFDALPSGTRFVAPDGSTRIKP